MVSPQYILYQGNKRDFQLVNRTASLEGSRFQSRLPKQGWAESRLETQMRTDREQGSTQRVLAPEAAPSVLVHRAACVILAPFISLGLKALIYKIIDGTRWNCLRNPCSSDSL